MKNPSKTDWKRLDSMKEDDINYDDIPELSADFFEKAELKLPSKKSITLRVDGDVLEWFKSQGQGYQTRINKLLRKYMEHQQTD